jgi:hypothetical protein
MQSFDDNHCFVVGAILLALIEGVGIAITRMTADQFKPGSDISQ